MLTIDLNRNESFKMRLLNILPRNTLKKVLFKCSHIFNYACLFKNTFFKMLFKNKHFYTKNLHVFELFKDVFLTFKTHTHVFVPTGDGFRQPNVNCLQLQICFQMMVLKSGPKSETSRKQAANVYQNEVLFRQATQ